MRRFFTSAEVVSCAFRYDMRIVAFRYDIDNQEYHTMKYSSSHEQQAVVTVWVPTYSFVAFPITKHTDAAKDLQNLEITAANAQLLFFIDIDAPLA
ncbi:hypothetical protein Tco_1269196 [Tanacetum coccineum]